MPENPLAPPPLPGAGSRSQRKYMVAGLGCLTGLLLSFIAAFIVIPRVLVNRTQAREMAAIKTITAIHRAQVQYFAQNGRYASTLQELGVEGERGGFRFVLKPTPDGYVVLASPVVYGTSGTHTYFSDQSMGIHRHLGAEQASQNDPLLGSN